MDIFIGEALCVHMRKGTMDGELYREDAEPLLYMGTKYDETGCRLASTTAYSAVSNARTYDSPLLKKYITKR